MRTGIQYSIAIESKGLSKYKDNHHKKSYKPCALAQQKLLKPNANISSHLISYRGNHR